MARYAQLDQEAQAGQRCRPGARGHQFDLLGVLAHHLERVEQCCANHDRRAVLVVVEDRNLHPFAQAALDVKTIWCLDVFQVDTAKGGLQRGNDVHQFVEVVFLVDFNVKHIDAGELLEQDGLALHHRLGGQRPDVPQAEHGRAIGDHRHQVAAAGVLEGVVGVFDDLFTRGSDARRVGQRQIMLVDQLFGGRNRDLARCRELVVFERGAAQLRAFFFGIGRAVGHVCLLLRPVSTQSWGGRSRCGAVIVMPATGKP